VCFTFCLSCSALLLFIAMPLYHIISADMNLCLFFVIAVISINSFVAFYKRRIAERRRATFGELVAQLTDVAGAG